MKTRLALLLGVVSIGVVPAAQAQKPAATPPAGTAENAYLDTRCIGTPSGKGDAYRDYMVSVTAKSMQVRADEGNISGWIFARSVITADNDCDFLQVNLHQSFPPERTPIDPYLVKAGLKTTRDEWYKRLGELTDAVRRELWRGVVQLGRLEKGNYLRIDYYKVNPLKQAQWSRHQEQLWRPAYDAEVRAGLVLGWQVDRIFLPGGSGYPYAARTFTALKDWSSVGQTPDAEAVARRYHKGRAGTMLAQDAEIQERVRSDLFQVVEVIRPRSAATAVPAPAR